MISWCLRTHKEFIEVPTETPPSNSLLPIFDYVPGPTRTGTVVISATSGPTICSGFNIVNSSQTPTTTVNCATNTLSILGSMNKGTPADIKSNKSDAKPFTLYPNPTNGKFCIKTESDVTSIAVYDLVGRKLGSLDFGRKDNFGSINLNLENLNLKTGTYFIEIKTGSRYQLEKLKFQEE